MPDDANPEEEQLTEEDKKVGEAKKRSRRRSDQPVNDDVANAARAAHEAEKAAEK